MTTAAPSAALAGFLAGYRGLTREAYALDLRQFTTWCRARSLKPFAVRHVSIESFARDLQAKGARPCHRHPAAVHHRRILQIRGRGRAPGPIAGRPRTPPAGRLRVQCRRPGPQRTRRAAGHRARLGVRACAEWAIDLAVGERTEGPIFLARDARRLDRHGAGRIVRRIARRAGITKLVTPHTLRHAFITAALDAGVLAARRARGRLAR